MAQQLFDGLQVSVRDDLRAIIRKELALENDQKAKAFTETTFVIEALWPVHELKATVEVGLGDKGVKIFDLVPGLTAGVTPATSWVGLSFPKETYASLHGDFTWHVTIHRKDGTAREKTTTSGKFNYGRFFVNTDELVNTWGTTFKTENFDGISRIIIDVHFKRNNEEKRTAWKTVDKHSNE